MADAPLNNPAPAHAHTGPLLCPHCKAVYDASEELEGKRVKCKVCGHVWRADTHAAERITNALHHAVSAMSPPGSTLLAAADHASTVGRLVSQTPREPRPPAGEWVGRRLGRYEIKAVIGQGAMGAVYEALDTELNRRVALKLLPSRSDLRETLAHRLFIQEARTAARISHPHVVTVFDMGSVDDAYFISLELVHGLTLTTMVKQGGPLAIEHACYIVAQAAQGLAAGHALDIIHRDVKPGNILIDESGLVKIADFGLAVIEGVEGIAELTGVAMGTPGWISPEVARGEPASAASDIYGLGLTLYFALTGQRLIKAKTKSGMIALQREARSIQFDDLPATWPKALRDILVGCLAADPGERYASAERLALDLLHIASIRDDDSVGDAKTVDLGERRFQQRTWFAVLLILLFGAVAYILWNRAR